MPYAHRVDGNKEIKLEAFDANETHGIKREQGETQSAKLMQELNELQELLYAAGRMSLLIVLQGRDTSGKDGAIRFLTAPLSSQGCTVASFKQPSERELAHDFLWRVHRETPVKGEMRIFNRSHYEDVLVVRVHHLVPDETWQRRYEHINNFERLLIDSNTLILKFYLNIDRNEQEERLRKREQDATKFWKLSVGDWQEREHWNAYTKAYEDAINRCSTKDASWYIVPANKKWFRNLALAETIVETLKPFRQEWMKELEARGQTEMRLIEEFRNKKAQTKS